MKNIIRNFITMVSKKKKCANPGCKKENTRPKSEYCSNTCKVLHWKKLNKEKVNAINRKYRKNNKEHINANRRILWARNKDRINKQNRDRQFKKWQDQKLRCPYCKELLPDEKRNAKFCSSEHKRKYYNEKDRTERLEKRKKIHAKGELICYYCGKPLLVESRQIKFCNDECCDKFNNLKRAGKEIPVKIDRRTTILTKKYDEIPQVRSKFIKASSFHRIMEKGPPKKIANEIKEEM